MDRSAFPVGRIYRRPTTVASLAAVASSLLSASGGLGGAWALAAAVAAEPAEPLLACEDAPGCADWLAPGDASNCTAFPSLLRLRCPAACGACAEHEPFRSCADDGAEGGGAGRPVAPRLVTSSASHDALASVVASSASALFGSKAKVLREGSPQVVQIDDFVSASEAASLSDLAEASGFERSERFIDGEAMLRTSSTVFCRGACRWSPEAAAFVERIASAAGVSAHHFEPVQFVRYRSGERYALHSDFVDTDVEAAHGPRLLTFFVYLSDGFEGGETEFPELGLKVEPKVGRAVVWTNCLVYVGGRSGRLRWLPDSRAEHEALPVGAAGAASGAASSAGAAAAGSGAGGVKYAANIWIHNGAFALSELYDERCRDAGAGGAGEEEGGGEL